MKTLSRSLIVCSAWLVLAGCALAGSTPSSAPREKMRQLLIPVAEKIKAVVEQEKQVTVAVAEFTGPAQLRGSLADGIEKLLIEELELLKKGIVRKESNLGVIANYARVIDSRSNRVSVLLRVTVQKETGDELLKLPINITDNELVSILLGLVVHLPPGEGSEALNNRVAFSLEQRGEGKVPYVIDGTKVSTSKESPYSAEVLVAPAGSMAPKNLEEWSKVKARSLQPYEGCPLVPVEKGDLYALRLTNNSKHEAAVTVAIDGIDVFQLSQIRTPDGRPRHSHYIIKPGQSALITGWRLNEKDVASFLVTGLGEGVAAKLARFNPNKTGTISVTFAAAWEGDNVPADEKGKRAAKATGEGPLSDAQAKEVKRSIGVIRDVIHILYDR